MHPADEPRASSPETPSGHPPAVPTWAALLAALLLTLLVGWVLSGSGARRRRAPDRSPPSEAAAPPSAPEPSRPPFGWDNVPRPLPATPVS